MKLALIQCDVEAGKLIKNCEKIAGICRQTKDVELCILPAGSILGPGEGGSFEALAKAEDLFVECPPLLLALPNQGNALLEQGKLSRLPPIFEFKREKVGVNIGLNTDCQLDIAVHTEARPYAPGMQENWELVLSASAQATGAFSVSPNLVGGYGSEIYNGQSLAMNGDGLLVGRAKAFAEDLLVVDSKDPTANRIEPGPVNVLEAQWLALNLGLRDFVHKAGAKKVALGLSGGMDSALVAMIAANCLGSENVTGIIMPSPYTSNESITDANELAKNLGIKTFTIPIGATFEALRSTLAPAFKELSPVSGDLTEENLQARIRGILLMAFSNKSGSLVLNTGNKSEGAMGYCTLYGDTVGAVAVIGDLFKTEVYALAAWACDKAGKMLIPKNIFDKAPSAELRPGQKDTDSLPPYSELDPALKAILKSGQAQDGKEGLAAKMKACSFKRRQMPPPLRVSDLPLPSFC